MCILILIADIRYGLEALDGYYRYHASINPAFVEDVIQGVFMSIIHGAVMRH